MGDKKNKGGRPPKSFKREFTEPPKDFKPLGKGNVSNIPENEKKRCDDEALKKTDLDDTDRRILRYLLEYPKISQREIGEWLHISQYAVSNRMNQPRFRKALIEFTCSTEDLLTRAANEAARRLIKLCVSSDDQNAVNAVRIALNRYLKSEVEMTVQPVVVYKSTIQADGSLIQEILKEERLIDVTPKREEVSNGVAEASLSE